MSQSLGKDNCYSLQVLGQQQAGQAQTGPPARQLHWGVGVASSLRAASFRQPLEPFPGRGRKARLPLLPRIKSTWLQAWPSRPTLFLWPGTAFPVAQGFWSYCPCSHTSFLISTSFLLLFLMKPPEGRGQCLSHLKWYWRDRAVSSLENECLLKEERVANTS